MKITKFYDDYSQSALYQSFRSIANYIDGQKPSSRKILYTVDKNNINSKIKVAQLMSKVAEQTQYLHGEAALHGTIVGLATDYVGANNINLLEPSGNFGCRFIPHPAAARYIFTNKSKYFDNIIKKEDFAILISQEFEGDIIEPKYFVPIIPLILVNGSEGIGNGFSQLILPRNPKELIKEIRHYLKNSKYKCKSILPWYKGFTGKIEKNKETGGIEIYGSYDQPNTYVINIKDLPIGTDLNSYLHVLNRLMDNKIIKGFEDNSENDIFSFKIQTYREFGKKDEEKIVSSLRLINKTTENFTCIDEDNKIVEFGNEVELLEAYIKVRLEYYSKRKKHILGKLDREIEVLKSRARFIKAVIDEEVIINNKTKDYIEKEIIKIKDIIKIEDSYDYLLKMSIYVLTKEKYELLKEEIKKKKEEIDELKKTSIEDLWIKELDVLDKII